MSPTNRPTKQKATKRQETNSKQRVVDQQLAVEVDHHRGDEQESTAAAGGAAATRVNRLVKQRVELRSKMASLAPTFLASLRAVGTASTMAGAGFYLHRRGFVTPSGKKMMALLSQQVTIPAFLFAKIIYCPSGGGSGEGGAETDPSANGGAPEIVCPSVANRIPDLWMLLLWPAWVVLCGLFTGYAAARVTRTPKVQISSCLAACAFGNSTGLPITLLSVIHKQFKSQPTELGRIDPTAFLSVYLLLYPVLQWGELQICLSSSVILCKPLMHALHRETRRWRLAVGSRGGKGRGCVRPIRSQRSIQKWHCRGNTPPHSAGHRRPQQHAQTPLLRPSPHPASFESSTARNLARSGRWARGVWRGPLSSCCCFEKQRRWRGRGRHPSAMVHCGIRRIDQHAVKHGERAIFL